jgi:hypothetical protein
VDVPKQLRSGTSALCVVNQGERGGMKLLLPVLPGKTGDDVKWIKRVSSPIIQAVPVNLIFTSDLL